MSYVPNTVRVQNYRKACNEIEAQLLEWVGDKYRPLTSGEITGLIGIANTYMNLEGSEFVEYAIYVDEIFRSSWVLDDEDKEDYKTFLDYFTSSGISEIFFDTSYFPYIDGERVI